MGIKASSLEELLQWARGSANDGEPNGSPLEAEAKLKLRQIKGKAADFIPYLLDQIGSELGTGAALNVGSKATLGSVIATAEKLLGSRASSAYKAAMEKYIEENDVSYKLKRA